MKRTFLYLGLMVVLFSCSKEMVDSSGTEILFEVNVDSNYFLGEKSWIVFSNLRGDVIEFEELSNPGLYTYQIEISEENRFHATIITYQKPAVVDDPWSLRESINLKTYAFLDGDVSTINLKSPDPINYQVMINSAKRLDISINVEENEIKESVISGTLTGAQNTNNYGGVLVKEGQETVFTYVHLNEKDNWSYKLLEDVEDNCSIIIDLKEMEEISTRFVNVPDFYDVEFRTTGIVSCEEDYAHSLQWYSSSENGIISSRYLPENNDLLPII